MKSNHPSVRLFVAVPVPTQIANELERWTKANSDLLPFRKWVHPQDYHITIQFLGETPIEKMDGLQTALRSITAKTASLMLNGAGIFGTPKSPRVLWAAVSGNLHRLNNLHASVIQSTQPLGYVPEDRPYTAHITLARNYTGEKPFNIDSLQFAPAGVEWKADRFILMQTHMNASPMYEMIESYPLLEK
ncbi:RNA 2',3'-cyclic phosphodiesterase [compost metagenome]